MPIASGILSSDRLAPPELWTSPVHPAEGLSSWHIDPLRMRICNGSQRVNPVISGLDFNKLLYRSNQEQDDDSSAPLPQALVIAAILLLTISVRQMLIRANIIINERLVWLVISVIYGTCLYFNMNRRWFDVTWILAPRQLLAIYMPISLFKTAYMIDLHTLKRSIVQVLIVGVGCAIINVTLLSTALIYIIRDNENSMTRPMGFICGAACTPVEVSTYLHVLNDFEKYKHLVTILEGEELFASITSLCIFEVALGFHEQYLVRWFQPIMIILRLIVLGLIIGVIMGLAIGWVMRFLNNAINVVTVTIVGTFLAWYISEYTFAFSGCITCTVVGFFMAKERASMSIDVDNYVNIFWNVFSSMNTTVFLIILLGMNFDRLMSSSDFYMYAPVFCTFAISILSRLLSLLMMTPILSRTGYGMDFRSMLLLIWANTKGPLPLLLSLMVFHYKNMKIWGSHIIAHVTGVCILCLLLNGSTIETLLKLFGFMELSNVRKSNMNNCMKFLQEKRNGMIAVLKMNRFLADANWPIVMKATMLQHPYKLKITTEEEDAFLWGARESVCPTCKKNIDIAPTAREVKDMTMEARMRVLKTLRISYIRQYENGMLSKLGIRSLLQAIEVGIDSAEHVIKLDDYFKIMKTKYSNEWFKIAIIKFLRKVKTEPQPPLRRYPKLCYNCISSRPYNVLFVLILVFNVLIIVITCLIGTRTIIYKEFHSSIIHCLILLIIFYTADVIANLIAFSQDSYWSGFKLYFRGIFNIIDCIVILLYIGLLLCLIFENVRCERILNYLILLRAFRLINTHNNLVPKLIQAYENRMDKQIMFAYDVGKALVNGYEESINILSQMVENKLVRDSIKKQIEDDRLVVTKELGMIQKDTPWIAISIKTKQASRATLNHMRNAVNDLKMSGFVDDFEYDKLKESIDESLKQERLLRVVTMSSPKRLFREVQWTGLHSEVSDFLYENISTQIWDTGDIIVKSGKKPDAVYILVTGLFRISYIPDKIVLHNLYQRGALPIMDYIPSSKFAESLEEFIFSGNSMGELCLVTDRPYNSTVIAEAPSQAYVLSHKLMREAMERNKNPINGLEARIWKYVSISFACELLQESPLYQSMTQEEIRLNLVRSFVPNLSCYKIFVINELIQDIILIEGNVMDFNTKLFFVAPSYIPRTVHKIVMPLSSFFMRDRKDSVRVKLLIIPMKDVDEMDIMDKAEDLSDLVSNPSNSCLIPKSYGKKMKRKKRLTKKAEEEKRRHGQKVLSVPEAEEDWVRAMGGIQVIDDDSTSVMAVKSRRSNTSQRSEEKSSGDSSIGVSSDKSSFTTYESRMRISIESDKSSAGEVGKDFIRLRKKQ